MNLLDLSILLTQKTGYLWTVPPNLDMGILTTNQAFILAKEAQKNPLEIVQQILPKINQILQENAVPAEANNLGPYINIQLLPEGFKQIIRSKSYLQLPQINQSFCIDMFSPNVGKKMHVGHMRSANLGEAMRRILSLKYNKVVSDNHLGDWGIQFSYTSWGILNLDKLSLDFTEIDLEKEDSLALINKFYQIYVQVNKMVETDEGIAKTCKNNAKLLETGLQNFDSLSSAEKEQYNNLNQLFQKIVSISITEFQEAEKYLGLNQNPDFLPGCEENFTLNQMQIKGQTGCHSLNQKHENGEFDMILGESFYIKYIPEFQNWVNWGLAKQEGEAIYVDLEKQNLGRCYLISSEGYSLYHSRDIINRIIYAGVFGFNNAVSFADLRQEHSFKQVFAVLQLLIDGGFYQNRTFFDLTQEQTDLAIKILSQKMSMFGGFGHFNLPEGAMSTRKGKIFEFSKLQEMLGEKVLYNLQEKGLGEATPQKAQNIAISALKWADLQRDREQDVVFDINSILKFEGNTGVYQLYTLARLKSILSNNSEKEEELNIEKFNQLEISLLKKTLTLPIILDSITQNFKPHILTTHLFEITSEINTWYAKYSVSNETDLARKKSLLYLCNYLIEYLEKTLSLLGLKTVEEI